jgi:adenylylsulfate kinase-like enzyme
VTFATGAPPRPTQQGVTVWFTGRPSAGKTTIGRVGGFLGVDDPYEPPLAPELVLDTAPGVARLLADGYRAQRG